MSAYKELLAGDPAPWFRQRSSSNPHYQFDTTAGRHILLCFFGSAEGEHARAAIDAVMARTDLFDDRRACFFGVSMDPADEAGRVEGRLPGYRYFWDDDGTVGKLYGALPGGHRPGAAPVVMERKWVLLDIGLRIVGVIPFAEDRSDIGRVLELVERTTVPEAVAVSTGPAPVLYLPRVFEPEMCAEMLAYCDARGTAASGFMIERDGRTVLANDTTRKRRTDCQIEDEKLKERIRMRVIRRIVPEVGKVYQFHVTRIERYLIGQYDAADRGFFHPHRDNTTKGTAHRRFAVSIGLNDDYEGGTMRFPEFGNRRYKLAAGAALIFSCSLLHTVDPVTAGQRRVLVPFLYDDAAAKIREKNLKFLNV